MKEIKEFLDKVLYDDSVNGFIISDEKFTLLKLYIIHLTKENERLKEANDILEENWKHYMANCSKAIEYINNFWREKNYYKNVENCLKFATMNEFEKEDLLNILQNGSVDNE